MKNFEHKVAPTKIGENSASIVKFNIFKFEKTHFDDLGHCDEGILSCEFLADKPEIGDQIKSLSFMGYSVFKIDEILEKRDSKVEAPFNGKDSFHKLKISRV